MKTIVLDTAALAQMVSLVAQANEEIDEAAELMNRVVSHNEWTCKERTRISEGIQSCKKAIGILQESTREFLTSFNRVLDDMVKKESGISKSFQGVESVLAKLLGAGLSAAGIGGAISSVYEIAKDVSAYESGWKSKLIDWQSWVWNVINGGDPWGSNKTIRDVVETINTIKIHPGPIEPIATFCTRGPDLRLLSYITGPMIFGEPESHNGSGDRNAIGVVHSDIFDDIGRPLDSAGIREWIAQNGSGDGNAAGQSNGWVQPSFDIFDDIGRPLDSAGIREWIAQNGSGDGNAVGQSSSDIGIINGRPSYGNTDGLPDGVVPIMADPNDFIFDAANFVEAISPVRFHDVLIGMSES